MYCIHFYGYQSLFGVAVQFSYTHGLRNPQKEKSLVHPCTSLWSGLRDLGIPVVTWGQPLLTDQVIHRKKKNAERNEEETEQEKG